MIERGGGVTTDFGGTNWSLLDVSTIWATLSDHDTENHWRLVSGWRRTCELTRMHLGRLTAYRDRLVAAWPPERSAAAREYVDRLNHLIDSLRQTHDVAAANYDTFSAATTAIGATRSKLREIHDEWTTKRQQKQEYDVNLAKLQTAGLSNVRGLRPPVTDVELERLNTRARELMIGLSGELRQAQAQLRQPPPYKPMPIREPGDPDIYGPDPSPIPPITPVPISNLTTNIAKVEARPQQAHTPNVPGLGPILGSAGPVLTPTPANPTPPGISSPLPSSTPAGVAGSPSTFPPSLGGYRPSPGIPLHPVRGSDSSVKPGANGITGARGLPPGGVIGGTPGAVVGQPPAGTSLARRVNPAGGVIGNNGTGIAPVASASQRPRSTGGQSPFLSDRGTPLRESTGGRHNPSCAEDKRWDPDHPWETIEGVDPVVRSPNEAGRIEPGPAIGLDQ